MQFKMSNFCLVLTLLQIIYLRETSAYGSGAPKDACGDLEPGHGNELQGIAPFEITLEKQEDSYKVTLAATDETNLKDFQGFILQGRDVNGKDVAIGSFTVLKDSGSDPPLAHAFQCNSAKDTVTHSRGESKKKVKFLWDPPQNFNGKIKFHATVAESQFDWWKGITSDEISIGNTPITKPTTMSTAAKTKTSTNGTTVDMTTPTSNAHATTSIFVLVVANLIIVMPSILV